MSIYYFQHKHHKAFKFKSAYKIQYNEHRVNNLKF